MTAQHARTIPTYPAGGLQRERLESELRHQIAIFNAGDPQTVLEAIRRIRELRVQLRQPPRGLDVGEDDR